MGTQPSQQQSVELVNYINEWVKSDFGVPMLMNSATDDVMALPNKYWHVTSLYKYGCGACSSKERNKWYNICDLCKEVPKTDYEVIDAAKVFLTRLKEVEDSENPTLTHDDSDEAELKCDTCNVVFDDVKELRKHFDESHPGKEVKFKRSRGAKSEKKKGRRVKNHPSKSIQG